MLLTTPRKRRTKTASRGLGRILTCFKKIVVVVLVAVLDDEAEVEKERAKNRCRVFSRRHACRINVDRDACRLAIARDSQNLVHKDKKFGTCLKLNSVT